MPTKKITFGLVFAFLIGLALLLFPWKSFLEKRIVAMLESKGFKDISFEIQDIGLDQVTLGHISFGKQNSLILPSLSIQYSLGELIHGSFQDVVLTGMDLTISQAENGSWHLAGIDAIPFQKTSGKESGLTEKIESLPLDSLTIKDSRLHLSGKRLQGIVPFSLNFTKKPVLSLEIRWEPARITVGANGLNLGRSNFKAAPLLERPDSWAGTWEIETIDPDETLSLPLLKAKGDFSLERSAMHLGGDFSSFDKKVTAALEININLEKPSEAFYRLASASFPFKEGFVSTENVLLKMPLSAIIHVQRVSVDALLQTLTGKKATATGTVSGSTPVTIYPNGNYVFGKGSLKSDGDGQIRMSHDAIPGSGEQIDLVRKILENLHYSVLSANVESNPEGKVSVLLKLEGNNPDVDGGRPVKLNVNLTGDVLDFVKQNIILFTTPEKLLEQEKDE